MKLRQKIAGLGLLSTLAGTISCGEEPHQFLYPPASARVGVFHMRDIKEVTPGRFHSASDDARYMNTICTETASLVDMFCVTINGRDRDAWCDPDYIREISENDWLEGVTIHAANLLDPSSWECEKRVKHAGEKLTDVY